jgi:hypothetical protein
MSRISVDKFVVTEASLQLALRALAEIVVSEPRYTPLLNRVANELQMLQTRREQIHRLLGSLEPPTLDLTAA